MLIISSQVMYVECVCLCVCLCTEMFLTVSVGTDTYIHR